MHSKISVIYTTVASIEEAEQLAEKAVESKQAACVNIIPNALSVYPWEGKIAKSTEYLLLFKTSVDHADALLAWIQDHHPYSVPALLMATIDTSADFHTYVQKHVSIK